MLPLKKVDKVINNLSLCPVTKTKPWEMVRKTIITAYLICLQISILAQSATDQGNRISLLFIGDIMGHDSQIWAAQDIATNTWDYNDVFTYIKPLISGSDLAIANLEVTLAGPPYKGYPQFSSPAALAAACKNAGIDCLVTANNHSADRGKQGITGTIFRLDSLGVPHTGTFYDQQARDKSQPLILNKNGISIAIMNYTYGTNGLTVPSPVIVNLLDKETVAADIEKAKSLKPDMIVLFLHWGTEYDTVPAPAQTALAEYFMSKGADLIIGSHPHVIQKMVWYNNGRDFQGKAVVYSLGNFLSNQRKPKTDGGAMVRFELEKSGNSVKVVSAGYILTWVYTPIIDYKQKFYVLPCAEFQNKPAFFSKEADYLQMKRFINDSRSLLNTQNTEIKEYLK